MLYKYKEVTALLQHLVNELHVKSMQHADTFKEHASLCALEVGWPYQ